jgi:hypothetical protein
MVALLVFGMAWFVAWIGETLYGRVWLGLFGLLFNSFVIVCLAVARFGVKIRPVLASRRRAGGLREIVPRVVARRRVAPPYRNACYLLSCPPSRLHQAPRRLELVCLTLCSSASRGLAS